MCQDAMNHNYGLNDNARFNVITGIASVSVANSKLDGSGTKSTVLASGGPNGTIIRSVIIKATGPVTTGMIRLFIGNEAGTNVTLFKEVPIQTTPLLESTPTPAPILPTYEIKLEGGFKLNPAFHLYATTQNAEAFNIIAEGVEWSYSSYYATICCNLRQDYANTGLGTVSTANTNLNGSGTIVSLYSAGGSGSLIKAITLKALQSTNQGMVRLFISPNGSTWSLMKEIVIPQTNQSGFNPSFKCVLEEDFYLQSGCYIGASTQITQSFAITVEGTDFNYPAEP